MKGTLRVHPIRNIALTMLATALLGGCLSSQSGEEEESTTALWKKRESVDVTLGGSVGDGPAVDSAIKVFLTDGRELANTRSDDQGRYAVAFTIAEDRAPLLIEAEGGIDIVTNEAPDFTLLSALWTLEENATANVNPFSTIAVEVARDLGGGINTGNLVRGQEIVVNALGSALTSLAKTGPVETPITGSNAAEIIMASEALGEIVRRTRDALDAAGYPTSGNMIVQRLGSDLIDGVIEGHGGPRADARTAAVATLVAAQVSLEAMTGSLMVNGHDASQSMRMAVDRVSGGDAQPALEELQATPNMIAMARIGLDAAMTASSNSGLEQVRGAAAGLQQGMDPVTVRGLLPPGFAKNLDPAIKAAAGGGASMHSAINGVARNGNNGTPVAENRPPVISGAPSTSVDVGSEYSFRPTASDLDEDSLTWSIKGKPDWASFSRSTGELSGTPRTSDAGTHANIRISVSDGEATSEMTPFSITVRDPNAATASVTIDWTPPTENEDGSTLTDLRGYRIYWGTTPGVHPNSVMVNDPGATQHVVGNLSPGTYEFVATAINSSGMESRVSNAITRTAE